MEINFTVYKHFRVKFSSFSLIYCYECWKEIWKFVINKTSKSTRNLLKKWFLKRMFDYVVLENNKILLESYSEQ